jgi:hypothetical protein
VTSRQDILRLYIILPIRLGEIALRCVANPNASQEKIRYNGPETLSCNILQGVV